jgi:hypothetical protein
LYLTLDNGEGLHAKTIELMYRYILAHLVCRTWLDVVWHSNPVLTAVGCVMTAVLALTVIYGRRPEFTAIGALCVGCNVIVAIPGGANHFFLEALVFLTFLACNPSKSGDRRLLTATLRWIPIAVMFHAGLKKVLFGTYFRGDFLAYQMYRDGYDTFFKPLLDPDEREQLLHLVNSGDDGPFVFRSLPALVASNAVYVTELIVAVLLLIPRYRRIGAFAGILVVVGIEFVAREIFFGLLLSNLLLMFTTRRLSHFAAKASICVAVGLVLLQLWVGRETRFFN